MPLYLSRTDIIHVLKFQRVVSALIILDWMVSGNGPPPGFPSRAEPRNGMFFLPNQWYHALTNMGSWSKIPLGINKFLLWPSKS